MPELPEAETVRSQVEPHVVGATIIESWAKTPHLTSPSVSEFIERTRGQKIVAAKRRGKQIYFPLENGDNLLVHLGMTGKLSIEDDSEWKPEELHRHVHGVWRLSNGKRWVFTDPRTFGELAVSRDLPFLTKMGPEPLDEDFPVEELVEKLGRKNVKIKAAILDQSLIAGLGNIYADEACFRARIHPETRASAISEDKLRELLGHMRPILEEAIQGRGSTLKDGGYQDANGDYGTFRPQMYGRTGLPCVICETPVQRGVLGASKSARSFHFCPSCQKL
ncbi:bifunctional DNA-formamidopyrimidine glycosylase/DNA-(apurinic or apyrimidinic site) lyase [bacterium]|nr:MAG: bifunctional DNA-formamidopyrimidine glycosylase/DNA-(apurinic or apyrimidinic site) lyase [bacterium]